MRFKSNIFTIAAIASAFAFSAAAPQSAEAQPITVLTNSDSNKCKDSTIYAGIENKPEFFINFECGSVGSIKFISIDTLNAQTDSAVQHLTYEVESRKDPINPVDTLLDPSSRWYFFLMTGVKGKAVTIKMTETDSRAPFFSYDGASYTRYSKEEAPETDCTSKVYTHDSVWVAYCIPYSGKYLAARMEEWQYRNGTAAYSIGKSKEGRDMKMLMITDRYVPDENKVRIYIHGRIHPSETPASWNLDGIIDYLTGNSDYAKALRHNAIFYILPFANPDGVAHGYSRCSSSGVNLEINYSQPDSLTEPEIKNIKKFITTTTYGGNALAMFLNYHSQIADHVTFWVHTAETTTPLYYKELMTFAALNTDSSYFDKKCLSFSSMNSKYLEGFFWDNFKGETIALTYETPYTFYNKNEDGEWVTPENLKKLGIKTVWAIGDYLGINNPDRIIALPSGSRRMDEKSDAEHIYLGSSYLEASEDGASVKYQVKQMPAGEYEVYKWSVGENKRVSGDDENCWIKLYNHTQERDGNFSLRLDDMFAGNKANALLFLRKAGKPSDF